MSKSVAALLPPWQNICIIDACKIEGYNRDIQEQFTLNDSDTESTKIYHNIVMTVLQQIKCDTTEETKSGLQYVRLLFPILV
jgi:hypothetical protein